MEKFVPYEKLSKKEKRRLDQARRGSWGDVNPVSRRVESKKVYNRKRTQDWKNEPPDPASCYFTKKGRSKLRPFSSFTNRSHP